MAQHAYSIDLLVAPSQTDMEYTRLGHSRLEISKIVLGAIFSGRKAVLT
jgi:hypothetical protein